MSDREFLHGMNERGQSAQEVAEIVSRGVIRT